MICFPTKIQSVGYQNKGYQAGFASVITLKSGNIYIDNRAVVNTLRQLFYFCIMHAESVNSLHIPMLDEFSSVHV